MKINIFGIVAAHFETLYDDRTKKLSLNDIIIFFILPIMFGTGSYTLDIRASTNFYEVSVSFYGIFIALLLNIQVVIFSIFQRNWKVPPDARLNQIQQGDLNLRRILIGELNTNISYLVVFSCVTLILIIVLDLMSINSALFTSTVVVAYSHFILTLVMIVKRSYALFQKEYRDAPSTIE